MSRKLILMRGVSGSGKTTLARSLLSATRDGIMCSAEDFFVGSDGQYRFIAQYADHAEAWNQVRRYVLFAFTNVIIVQFCVEFAMRR
jgi:uridine kinase